MGVTETSPSVPQRDGEGAFKYKSESSPDRLERAQARGLDARLHLLGYTERRQCQSCTCGTPRPVRTLPMPVEISTPHARGSREKTPAGALTLLQGFGG
jgi:hypothetical protein